MTREYEKTHGWIKFALDFNLAPYDLWIALGEVQSKCEHISGTPLKPAVAQDLPQHLYGERSHGNDGHRRNTFRKMKSAAVSRATRTAAVPRIPRQGSR
jgi:hypothetical protein